MNRMRSSSSSSSNRVRTRRRELRGEAEEGRLAEYTEERLPIWRAGADADGRQGRRDNAYMDGELYPL